MNPITLLLIRHAEAADNAPSGHDRDRPLTPRGHEQAQRLAKALASAGVTPQLILTSPWLRAQQTSEHLGGAAPVVDAHELVSPNITAALRAMGEAATTHQVHTLAAVGHEPWISQLGALAMSGSDVGMVVHMRKASMLMLSGRPTPGLMTLEAFVPVGWLQ